MTNAVHQADLFLSHDIQGYGQGWKTYKCALTVVDVASHFKEAEPLTLKDYWSCKQFSKKLLMRPFEMATVASGWPRPRIHGTATKEMEKQNKHSTWVPWAPLWLGNHWKV